MREILEFHFINIGTYQINLLDILEIAFILFCAKILTWALSKVLIRAFRNRRVDSGRQFAVRQFIKYIIYTLTLMLVMQTLGLNMSILWTGSAALMVGIGLGMQEFFMNLISGIILLVEGSVDVDDIVVVDGFVARVVDIGMRTSKVETRDAIVIIVPNSKLVANNVINWSHNRSPSRFNLNMGVSYASDTDQVKELVEKIALDHPKVLKTPAPDLQFIDFGESSLDFTLHFYCLEFWAIEKIKSDLRFKINRVLREAEIEIPFPQRDLWFRNAADVNTKASLPT